MKKLAKWIRYHIVFNVALTVYKWALWLQDDDKAQQRIISMDDECVFPYMNSRDPYQAGAVRKIMAVNMNRYSAIMTKKLRNQ